jgi:hypothetical protein
MNFLGFEIKRALPPANDPQNFVVEDPEDGSMVVAPGGAYATTVDLDGTVKSDVELITKYREVAQNSDVEIAIDEIINQMIVIEDELPAVQLTLEKLKDAMSPDTMQAILDEFEHIMVLFNFDEEGYELAKKWYVDGRIYFQMIVNDPAEGITKIKYIDPRKIKKVIEKSPLPGALGAQLTATLPNALMTEKEYFVYSERGFFDERAGNYQPGMQSNAPTASIKLTKDSVIYVTSGMTDSTGTRVLSYVHKAIKPLNQLVSLEDASVIYRLARAPERRAFYIDVGNLPKNKAEQYLRDMMIKHKNKLSYDASTGEIRDDRKFMTMLEDYWLPRRDGTKGTEIVNMPGGQNLGEMDDVLYFQKRLYRALNVPPSRIEGEQMFSIGNGSEVSRDEVKFTKFVKRLRNRFGDVFFQALEKQLILKNIVAAEDWEFIKSKMSLKFADDIYFAELKENEILNARLATAVQTEQFMGTYFSRNHVRRKILKQTDEEIQQIQADIAEELATGEIMLPDPNADEGGPGGPP